MSAGAPPVAQDKISEYGLDAICSDITGGKTLTAIAVTLKVSIGSLLTWRDSLPERSARVREARASAASLWDEKAETGLKDAADPFELARAKELAFHYRWRSSKAAPADYGDKSQVEVAGKLTLESLVAASLGAATDPE